jgi:hypothetical protein
MSKKGSGYLPVLARYVVCKHYSGLRTGRKKSDAAFQDAFSILKCAAPPSPSPQLQNHIFERHIKVMSTDLVMWMKSKDTVLAVQPDEFVQGPSCLTSPGACLKKLHCP